MSGAAALVRTRPNEYQQTEAGYIPRDWSAAKLGPLVHITSGESPSRFRFAGGGIPYFKVEQLNLGNKFLLETPYYIQSNRFVRRGSLIFPKRGASILLNKIRLLAHDSFFDTNLMSLSPVDHVDAMYLYYALTHVELWRIADVTSIPQINNKHIIPLHIPLPPSRQEQQLIAEALSDADALIEGLESLIAKKRAIKQGAMQELLTGKRRLPGCQKPWVSKLLPEVSRFRGGKAHEQFISETGQYVCVNSKFISSDGKVRKYSTENFCSAKIGDIMMVMSDLPNGKALAKTFISDRDDYYAVNQRVCALTPIGVTPVFLAYVLNRNPYFLKFDDGVSQTHLLNPVFQKCPVRLPPTVAEQEAIAQVLSEMDAELDALDGRLAKARQVKQGMMQELLTGRIRLV